MLVLIMIPLKEWKCADFSFVYYCLNIKPYACSYHDPLKECEFGYNYREESTLFNQQFFKLFVG